eukprot:5123097-Amphidinium_carterae.1
MDVLRACLSSTSEFSRIVLKSNFDDQCEPLRKNTDQGFKSIPAKSVQLTNKGTNTCMNEKRWVTYVLD